MQRSENRRDGGRRARGEGPRPPRRFAVAAAAVLLAIVGATSTSASDADEPKRLPRVMSLNVCTDQLVLALASRDQIASLSNLSDEPGLSYFHRQARGLPENRGLAEEAFVERPDVVVTGTYSLHDTTPLLRHLGVRVEEFDYTQTLDGIPHDIRRMGAILGHPRKAEAMASEFETELGRLRRPVGATAPTAIIYGQNSVVVGSGTLADSVLEAAGFRNLAAELGYSGMRPFPLELVVKSRPDVILLSRPYDDAPALADQIARHPAIRAIGAIRGSAIVPEGSWACGGPFTIEALRALSRLHDSIAARHVTDGSAR